MAGEFGYMGKGGVTSTATMYIQFETGKIYCRKCVVEVIRAMRPIHPELNKYGDACVATTFDYEGKSCDLCGKEL
jgi:Zn finger protein HypA/HybF involved in hydrogenase expression